METWTPVVGYEGLYEVSDLGSVRSIPRKGSKGGVMKTPPNKYGYPEVNLTKGGAQRVHLVHHLVMTAFVGTRPKGMIVRHRNGMPGDNRRENLVYGTMAENTADMLAHGRSHQKRKTHCPSNHEYTPENTRVTPSRPNARYCKACEKARVRPRKTVAAA